MLLEITNLHFSYQPEKKLFQHLNLQVGEGKAVALAGESGCGKSTLLNLIYGTLDWQEGEILFSGRKLQGPKGNIVPGEPDIKLVSQQYDLMPYANVYDNVGKFISNTNIVQKKNEITELLHVIGMEEFALEKPHFLSGGQQQRVAIARALARLPKLLLLDEPFSSIDFFRTSELRERLFGYAKKNNITILISTHEIQEVMPWLDEIIILKNGEILQHDPAEETYRNPKNAYVARLFGEVNVLSEEQKNRLQLSKNLWYPHEITLSETGIAAEVLESRFAGNHYRNKILIQDLPLLQYSQQPVQGQIKLTFSKKS